MSEFSRDPNGLPNLDGLTRPLVELAHELRSIDETLREQNRSSQRRYRLGVLGAVLAVAVVVMVGVAMWTGLLTVRGNQAEIKKLGEIQITEALRRERDVLVHRERKEVCLIRPFNEVVQHRINSQDRDVHIDLCNPDETLEEIRPRIEGLDRRIEAREELGYG